jgi:heptosyltransferase-2
MADIDTSKIHRILMIMMGGIGDMILFTPALAALRKAYPSSTICLLLGPYGAEKVIEGSHLLDKKIMISPKKYKGVRGKIKLIQELRKEKFCLSITSTGTNPIKSGLLCYLSGIKYRLGENIEGKGFFYNLKVPFNENSHDVESNLSLIQKLGIKAEEKSLYIHRSLEDKNFAQRFFSDLNLKGKIMIGMHPGSGIHQARFRRWPKERFAQLADWIINSYNASVILFGGPEEMSLASEIKAMMRSNPILMTGKTTLNQAAALIEKCSLFISNDSGLMHVACAVNTPTIGIYGPTNYKKLGPYSDSARIIRKELDCSPCYKREKVKCSQLTCFKFITVEDVLQEVSGLLKKNGKSDKKL